MCVKCDSKVVLKPWKMWITIAVTLLIFVFSQVFLFGQFTGEIKTHLNDDPTMEELRDEFVSVDRFNTLEGMVRYLYEKEGGE